MCLFFLFPIPWRCEPWSTGCQQDLFFRTSAPSLSLFSAIPLLSGHPATISSVTPCGITVILKCNCHQTTCAVHVSVAYVHFWLFVSISVLDVLLMAVNPTHVSVPLSLFRRTSVVQPKNTFVSSVMKTISVPLMSGSMNDAADVRFPRGTLKFFWYYWFLSCFLPQGKPHDAPFHSLKLFLKPLGCMQTILHIFESWFKTNNHLAEEIMHRLQ